MFTKCFSNIQQLNLFKDKIYDTTQKISTLTHKNHFGI